MARKKVIALWKCRKCGRKNKPKAKKCWFCKSPNPSIEEDENTV